LSKCFFNTGVIECWGSGILRMATALEEQEQPRPEFAVATPNVFKIIMFAAGHTDNQLHDLGLNIRQVEVIHYLRLKGSIASSEYRVLSGVNEATDKRDLSEKGLVAEKEKVHLLLTVLLRQAKESYRGSWGLKSVERGKARNRTTSRGLWDFVIPAD
jgi:predicted HTH transcriptional regulator